MATFELNPAPYEPFELEALKKLIAKLDENKIDAGKWEDYQKRKDKFLIRYLKAYKYDVDKSYEKFVKFLEWRKENNIDNVLWEKENDPKLKQVFEAWPVALHKTDNCRMPVVYEKIGPADIKGIFQAFPDTDYWIRNHILMHEGINHLIFTDFEHLLDQPYQGIIFIEDLNGLGFHHWYTPAITVMKAVSEIDTQYYPHAVRKLYIINAPSVFTWMWKLVKPWLDPFTANSMVVLGSDFYDVLAKEIPPQNIPKEYGGLCECPTGCLPKAGPYVGERSDDTMHATVPRQGCLKVPLVLERGCTLKWEFTTASKDIGFEVIHETDEGRVVDMVKSSRCNSHEKTIGGSIQAPESGTYALIWDNSYSLLRSKDLTYKINVEAARPND